MNGTFGKRVLLYEDMRIRKDLYIKRFIKYTGRVPCLLEPLLDITPVQDVIFRPLALSQIRHTTNWLLDKVEGISAMLKVGVIAVLHTVVKMKGA